jgi:hypothetical protein
MIMWTLLAHNLTQLPTATPRLSLLSSYMLCTRQQVLLLSLIPLNWLNSVIRLLSEFKEKLEIWKTWNHITMIQNHQQIRDYLHGLFQNVKVCISKSPFLAILSLIGVLVYLRFPSRKHIRKSAGLRCCWTRRPFDEHCHR